MFWPDKNLILCVEEGATQLRTVSGETLVDYGSQGAVTVLPDNLATFANQGDYVFMAGGAKLATLMQRARLRSLPTQMHLKQLRTLNSWMAIYWPLTEMVNSIGRMLTLQQIGVR
jgi:hypothetical protein